MEEQAGYSEAKLKVAGDPKARTQVTKVGPQTALGRPPAPAALPCAGAPRCPFSRDFPEPPPHAMAGRTQPHADWKVPVLTLGSKRASPIPRAKPQQLLTVPGADWKAPPLVTKVKIHVETSSPKVRFARAVVRRVTARSDGPSTGSLRVKRVAKGEVGFES